MFLFQSGLPVVSRTEGLSPFGHKDNGLNIFTKYLNLNCVPILAWLADWEKPLFMKQTNWG